jgi:hypothetical protein
MLRLRRGTAAAPVAGLLFLAVDRLLAQWCEALDSEARAVPAPALTALTLGFASGIAAPATGSGLSLAASSSNTSTTTAVNIAQQQLLLPGRKQSQQGRAQQSAVASKGFHHHHQQQQHQHQQDSSRAVLREAAAECTAACVEWAKAATAGAITAAATAAAAAATAAAQSTEAGAEQCRPAGVSEAGAKRRATGSSTAATNATANASNTAIRGDDCDGSNVSSRASTAATTAAAAVAAAAAVRETDGHIVEALGRWAVCIKRSMTEAGGCRYMRTFNSYWIVHRAIVCFNVAHKQRLKLTLYKQLHSAKRWCSYALAAITSAVTQALIGYTTDYALCVDLHVLQRVCHCTGICWWCRHQPFSTSSM